MASSKGCPDNAGVNPNLRIRPRSPASPRPCAGPGVQVRPRSQNSRGGSPPRALMTGYRPPANRPPPGNTQYRPRATPPSSFMGSPDLDLMTSGEMQSFDCPASCGASGLYSSDDGRYSPYGGSTMPSSYYSNSSGASSPPQRTRTTTSTTIITTEEEEDDDEDDDEDYSGSPAGGSYGGRGGAGAGIGNATYTRSPPPPAGGRTFTCAGAQSGNATYNVGSGAGSSPGTYTSDFSDFDYDTGNYSTTPSLGLYSTYNIEPASFEVGPPRPPLRGPIPGPGCAGAQPGGAGGAGPSGVGGPANPGHNKTFTKIIKKVVTETPSSERGVGPSGKPGDPGSPCTPGAPGGQGMIGQSYSGNIGRSPMNQSDFARGIRQGGQSTPMMKCPGQCAGASGAGGTCPAQPRAGNLNNDVQRHLDELECTERDQINSDLAMFQQARRRLVEVTTTISNTQPPVNFSGSSGCSPGGR